MASVLGSYGGWAARLHVSTPGRLSLRRTRPRDLHAWRRRARARVWECLAPPPLPGTPRVRVDGRGRWGSVSWERLSWQLPWGPRTEAVYLRPASASRTARLPAVLALHDHGGQKFFGWRKIARIGDALHPVLEAHHRYYGGRAWANALAERGYAVLVPDTFSFGSRRVRLADVPEAMRSGVVDPREEDADQIGAYNSWACGHEQAMTKSLLCAGTTWPGIYVREDQTALSILEGRDDVDPDRIACGGLSGGGMRTAYLAGLDERIRCTFSVGFMTTWRDFLHEKCLNNTWMIYPPLLAQDLDFPELLALRAPAPTLVQCTNQDGLFTLPEMRRATRIMREVYRLAGAPEAMRASFRDGPHHFDLPMQEEAFAWVDRWIGSASATTRAGAAAP
jgi:dienelactone hydrolase